jgi:hypothetical protein
MDVPVMICAICRRTLDLAEEPEGSRYQHTFQDSVGEDHDPLPIFPDANWAVRCDFCNTDAAAYHVPARDFAMPNLPGHRSSGAWAACRECGTLVDTNQWSKLIRRVVEKYAESKSPMTIESQAALAALYRELRKNISGPMREI